MLQARQGKTLIRKRNRMVNDSAHKSWWQIFEVIFGFPFLVSIVLKQVIPIPRSQGFLAPAIIPIGVVFIVVGVSLTILARKEFAQYAQPTDPGLPTNKIITTGVFSISRNPLYLGGIFLLTGISFVFNLPWFLFLLIPTMIACHYILIAPEERYLATRFDEQYRAYTSKVHRWIGRK